MTDNQTHFLRARIDQLVKGMDDTAVVAVRAESKAAAIQAATKPHLDADDYYKFNDGVWSNPDVGRERPPATGPVHYLGTEDALLSDGGPIRLSEVEGERVTDEHHE